MTRLSGVRDVSPGVHPSVRLETVSLSQSMVSRCPEFADLQPFVLSWFSTVLLLQPQMRRHRLLLQLRVSLGYIGFSCCALCCPARVRRLSHDGSKMDFLLIIGAKINILIPLFMVICCVLHKANFTLVCLVSKCVTLNHIRHC